MKLFPFYFHSTTKGVMLISSKGTFSALKIENGGKNSKETPENIQIAYELTYSTNVSSSVV